MMADGKILFAKWSLFSYMGVNFIQAAVQRCPYSNFHVTGRLEFLLFIGGSEGVRSPPQAVQWEIQPMQNMWVVEHCIMSLSLTPFWPRAWGSSYKWSHAVFVFVSGLFHLMWSALGSYMFVRLDSILLCLCIIVSLCIHPIDGILGWCPVLVTINSAILNRVPMSLELADLVDFVNTPTTTPSSAIWAVMEPTLHCCSKAWDLLALGWRAMTQWLAYPWHSNSRRSCWKSRDIFIATENKLVKG